LKTVVKVVNTGEWFDLSLLARLSRRGRPWLRWLTQGTDHWVAISLDVAEHLRKFGIAVDRITHLPNGVEVPATAAAIPAVATRFLYLGRLADTAPRDIDGLLSAFAAVAQKNSNVRLAIVGGGNRLAAVRAAVSASGRANVVVPGTREPMAWLNWAHCMVQPSFFEGMSNALLEGMAAGLACVAYDIPPNREAFDDGAAGMLVPAGDRDRLGAALVSLACDEGLARSWGRRARSRAASSYDITPIATRTIKLYEELLAREAR
jgi:glycosyltransferase involved in cell wall biosynthesis